MIGRRTFIAGSAAAAYSAPPRPNLVYVFADQLGYQHCGHAGDEGARTPNIDRLGTQGCDFRQAISNSPVCAPYRASLMTGRHQSSTGMVINELRLSPEHRCFGHALTASDTAPPISASGTCGRTSGAATSSRATASFHLGRIASDSTDSGPPTIFLTTTTAPYFRDTPDRQTWKGYEPDAQTDMAIEFLRKSRGEPQSVRAFPFLGTTTQPMDEEQRARETSRDVPGCSVEAPAEFLRNTGPIRR
jgi:hypothetical protein